MIVVGVDPGSRGAIAVVDAENGRVLEVVDIPIYEAFIGKKLRRRLDEAQLLNEANRIKGAYQTPGSPALLVVIEQVGPREHDSNVSAFAFGAIYGEIRMAFKATGYRSEHVRPQDWKKAVGVPVLKGATDKAKKAAAVARADDMFPQDGAFWRGPRGGTLHDRAEAAMIAQYGIEKIAPKLEKEAA